jgi:hypothetical protein
MVDGRHLDADYVESRRVAPAGYENASVGADDEVSREVEATATLIGYETDGRDGLELEFR